MRVSLRFQMTREKEDSTKLVLSSKSQYQPYEIGLGSATLFWFSERVVKIYLSETYLNP